jgi:RES domain-containing protein
MVLWRISDFADIDGIGGELFSGRWHTAAEHKRIVYFAEHPAVSVVENLVNLRRDPTLFPDTFQLLRITAPGNLRAQQLTPKQLARIDPNDLTTTQAIGDAWLAARKSPLLRVPSIPSPESWNYLFNPLHPRAASIKVDWARRITYDKRLFHLSHA